MTMNYDDDFVLCTNYLFNALFCPIIMSIFAKDLNYYFFAMRKLLYLLVIIAIAMVACKPKPVVEEPSIEERTVTLSADTCEIFANGEDTVTFMVMCNNEDVTESSLIYFSQNNHQLGSYSFSTTEPDTISFYAKYENIKSNEVTIIAKEIIPKEGPLELYASTDTIVANGVDAAVFTVIQDSVDVTSITKIYVNDSIIESNEFTTTISGLYKIYASKNDTIISNEITLFAEGVVDPDEPISFMASTDTIVANGIDVVLFTAKQGDVDVTDEIDIYVNGDKIEGDRFTTTKPGIYKAFGKKNDLLSNEVTFVAKEFIEQEVPIVITASTDTIVADGIDEVIFTVTEGRKVITDDIDIFVNGNKIEGNSFSTTTAGDYKAYAKRGDVTSNEVSFYAKEYEEPEIPEEPIVLTTSTNIIIADGVDAITFTAMQGDENVTNQVEIFVNGSKINGNVYTTTVAGNYTAYAKKNEITSNEVSFVAEEYIEPEKPIELSSSTNTIIANGSDVITFTVMQDGDNVTNQSEIYVNNSLISGNQFSTFTPGTYTAYAKKNEVVSNEITFTAENVPDSGTTIVFAEGVTVNSGWYDVNKVGMGDNGDINMCWAASCSNIIQWWQDRYVAAGNTLPAGAVTGPGANGTYQLALMDMYHDLWNNERGGSIGMGIEWYFTGRNIEQYASPGSIAVPWDENSGGYYKDIWESEILPNTYHDYVHVIVPGAIEFDNLISVDVNNYNVWGGGSGLNGIDRLRKFSELVVEYMSRGMMSLTISLNSNGGLMHATTLWGYEIDNATGLLTKVWLTDSDDLETEPKTEILHECTVSYDEVSGKVKFTGIPRYGAFYAMTLSPVSIYGSR